MTTQTHAATLHFTDTPAAGAAIDTKPHSRFGRIAKRVDVPKLVADAPFAS